MRILLKQLRKDEELTQQEVADKINVGQVTYARYENGTRRPSSEMLVRLAELFNVSTDYLLGHSDESNSNSPGEADAKFHSRRAKKLLMAYERLSADSDPAAMQKKAAIDMLLGLTEPEDE